LPGVHHGVPGSEVGGRRTSTGDAAASAVFDVAVAVGFDCIHRRALGRLRIGKLKTLLIADYGLRICRCKGGGRLCRSWDWDLWARRICGSMKEGRRHRIQITYHVREVILMIILECKKRFSQKASFERLWAGVFWPAWGRRRKRPSIEYRSRKRP
jgi:hypothetical protein